VICPGECGVALLTETDRLTTPRRAQLVRSFGVELLCQLIQRMRNDRLLIAEPVRNEHATVTGQIIFHYEPGRHD